MLGLFTYHISSVTLCFEGSNTGGCTEGTKVNSFEEVASQVQSLDHLILLLRQKDEDFVFESSLDAVEIIVSGDAQNNFFLNISSSSQISASCYHYEFKNITFKSNSKEQITFYELSLSKVNFEIYDKVYAYYLFSDIASLSTSKVTSDSAKLTIDSTFSNITFKANDVNLQYPNGYQGTTTIKQIDYDHYFNISKYGDMMITRLDIKEFKVSTYIKGDLVLISNNTQFVDCQNIYPLEDGAFLSISEYGHFSSNNMIVLTGGKIKLNQYSEKIMDLISATDCVIDITSSPNLYLERLSLNGNIELIQDGPSSLKVNYLHTYNLNLTTNGLNMSVSYWAIMRGLDGTNINITYYETISCENIEIPFPFVSDSFSIDLKIEAESINKSVAKFKEFRVGEIKINTDYYATLTKNKERFLGLVGKKFPLFGASKINISKIHTEIPSKESPWSLNNFEYWREENALYEYVYENSTMYFVLIESPYRRNVRVCQGCSVLTRKLNDIGDVTKNDWINDITEHTKAVGVYVNRDVEGFVMTLPKDIPKKVEFHIIYGKGILDFDESSSLNIDFENISYFTNELIINFTKVKAIKPTKIEIDRIMISGDKALENVDFSGTKDIIVPVEQAMGTYDLKDVKKIGLLTYFTQPIVTLHKEFINFVLNNSNSYNASGFEDITLYCPVDSLTIERAKEDETVQKLKVFLINKEPGAASEISLSNFKESDRDLIEIINNTENMLTFNLGNYNPIIINADVSLRGSDNATHIVESQEFSGKGISINSLSDTTNITIPQITITSDSEFKFDHKINIGKIFIKGNSSVTTHRNTEYIMENSEEVKFIALDSDLMVNSVIINNSLPHYIPKLKISNEYGIVYIDNYTLLEVPPVNKTFQIAESGIYFNLDNFHFPNPYDNYTIRVFHQNNGYYLIHEYIPDPSPSMSFSPEPSPSDSSSKTAAIIGGTVGGVVVIGVIGVVVFLCMMRKKFNESLMDQRLI